MLHSTSNVILTDSLCSILALSDLTTLHPVLQNILVPLTLLDREGKSVLFCWIPSHVGVMGNDKVDEAAKRACKAICTRSFPLLARDLYPAFSGFIRGKWQRERQANVSSKLGAIKPCLRPWRSSSRGVGVEEAKLCRLCIVHRCQGQAGTEPRPQVPARAAGWRQLVGPCSVPVLGMLTRSGVCGRQRDGPGSLPPCSSGCVDV